MFYYSTRNKEKKVTLAEAISIGLADDGGLFLPAYFPKIDLSGIDQNMSYANFAAAILKDYFAGDILESSLGRICHNAFNFPLPLTVVDDKTQILELYHGPTLSFKDFGAQFLSETMNELAKLDKNKKITVMVATSGDTGSAVANAFYGKSNINIVVLFPKGQISKRQEQQIATYSDNVVAIAVNGNFDNCQSIVKEAFTDKWWENIAHISSANSINLGRLLPQMTYYAYTSYHSYLKTGKSVNFIIPTGNLGNATAAYFAKSMGFPIDKIVLSTNANKIIPDFVKNGIFTPKASVATLANAMDVGNPSNFERLHTLYPNFADFVSNVSAYSVNDEQIRQTITSAYAKSKVIICPHTATAVYVRENCLDANDADKSWIVVSTAHPSKFETVIEPLLGITIPVPDRLNEILHRESLAIDSSASLNAVTEIVKQHFFRA
ncbi:MAG: threonine synthase [Burkholderiales bacterium]|jgi:threonine synthase|nr:threonine synthase [Burkholderiales bacterium]